MTELELLEDKIGELRALLNKAWRDLSGSPLTPFERRELRNEMKRCSAELQRCLEFVQAEHDRSRVRLAEDRNAGARVIDFRLIGQSGKNALSPISLQAGVDTHR